jgi:hypothetical protein
MKFISKKQITIFLAGLFISGSYYLGWYLFKWAGILWHTKYNIPGFFILCGSLPWSWPFIYPKFDLGHNVPDILTTIIVCFGFSLNLTILISLCGKLRRITKEIKLT